jgi:quinol monooxygenase YgiN
MALTVIARLKTKRGTEKQVEQLCRDMAVNVRQEPDTLTYILHHNVDDPNTITVYEVYRDRAAFEFHSKTPYMGKLFEQIGPLMEGSPQVDIMEEFARK